MSSICRSTDSEAFQPIGKPILATSSAKKRNFSIEMVQGISNHWLTVCTTFNKVFCPYTAVRDPHPNRGTDFKPG